MVNSNENFVKLLENFNTSHRSPLLDRFGGILLIALKVYNGSSKQFELQHGTSRGNVTGDLWWDTTNSP